MSKNLGHTSFDKRQLVFHHAKGKSVRAIAFLLQMSPTTIHRIITRFDEEDRIDFKKSPGQTVMLSDEKERFILRSVAKNPKVNASSIAIALSERRGNSISIQTLRRVLKRSDSTSYMAICEHFISEKTFRICDQMH